MSEPATRRSVLITGCSSGIGHASAQAMRTRGWRVFAAARKPDDVARLAGEGFEAVRLDYDDEASIAAALDRVLAATGGKLDGLFNNGGMANAGAIEDLPTDLLRAQFQTNLFGWHELTRRVIPVMRAERQGRIVFCSSVLGFVAARFRGAYVASKHAVEGYADTLRVELKGSGIEVVLIEPGPIRSAFIGTARTRIRDFIDVEHSIHRAAYEREIQRLAGGESSSTFRMGPEAVAAVLARALESPRPKARYRVTVPTKVAAVLKRVLTTRALDRIVGRTRKG